MYSTKEQSQYVSYYASEVDSKEKEIWGQQKDGWGEGGRSEERAGLADRKKVAGGKARGRELVFKKCRGGGGDMGREELRRRGGQRGEQQVVCTSVTLCSSRPRMPRMNRGGGRRAGGQGGGGKGGHYATSKRSITKQAYIYFEAEFKKFLSSLYIAQKRWKACLWVEWNPFYLVSQKCIW